MLTLYAPHIVAELRKFPGGLFAFATDGHPSLAIKAHKEFLLAARVNRGLRFYVAPLPIPQGLTIGLVTAFFEDHDEPLTIRTPLLGGDNSGETIVHALLQDELDIYFFDEHTREWMGCRCTLKDDGSLLASCDEVMLLETNLDGAVAMERALDHWFSRRTGEDDARAITVRFADELWPADISIMDATRDGNDYWGGAGHSVASLVREIPGYFQERDIVAGFKRSLTGHQILLNPLRTATKKEFADVVAGTDHALIIVQAKDSPNTATSLARDISRKRRTAEKQLKKALGQAKGALDYARSAEPVRLWISGEDLDLYLAGREIISLVVIREIFPSQWAGILEELRAWRRREDALVILDYPGFHALTHQFSTEAGLIEALKRYTAVQLETGAWLNPQHYATAAFVAQNRGTF